MLVLHEVGLLQTARRLLRSSVKHLGLRAYGHCIFGHLILKAKKIGDRPGQKVERGRQRLPGFRMDKTQPTEMNEIKKTNKYVRNNAGQYMCPHCDKVTDRQNTMYYHIKKHLGNLDYPCTVPGCTKAFIQKGALQQHVAQTHPAVVDTENPYANQIHTCTEPGCKHTCRMKANLQIHMARKHSPWIPIYSGTCVGCVRPFASATAYYYHAWTCEGLKEPIEGPAEASTDTCIVTSAEASAGTPAGTPAGPNEVLSGPIEVLSGPIEA